MPLSGHARCDQADEEVVGQMVDREGQFEPIERSLPVHRLTAGVQDQPVDRRFPGEARREGANAGQPGEIEIAQFRSAAKLRRRAIGIAGADDEVRIRRAQEPARRRQADPASRSGHHKTHWPSLTAVRLNERSYAR